MYLCICSIRPLCNIQIWVLIFHIGLAVLDKSFILFDDLNIQLPYYLSRNCSVISSYHVKI